MKLELHVKTLVCVWNKCLVDMAEKEKVLECACFGVNYWMCSII